MAPHQPDSISSRREREAIHETIKSVFRTPQLCPDPPPTPCSDRAYGLRGRRSILEKCSRRLTAPFAGPVSAGLCGTTLAIAPVTTDTGNVGGAGDPLEHGDARMFRQPRTCRAGP